MNLTETVPAPISRNDFMTRVWAAFPDVERDGHVAGSVFGSADGAPGNCNTVDSHNGAGHPKHLVDDTGKMVPSQVIHNHGPVDGAILLADAWIDHLEDLQDGDVADWQSRTLIARAAERYGWKMGVCEDIAEAVAGEAFDVTPEARTMSEVAEDEYGRPKVDARFTDGTTMQVKTTELKHEGCDVAALVETPDPSEPVAKVTLATDE
jgi:hypothetical protein